MDYEMSNGMKAVQALERSVNCMGDDADAKTVVNGMANLHRTLNQALTGNIILPFIRRMAADYDAHNYDARNETACQICKVMWEAVKEKYHMPDNGETRLPLI